MSKQQTIKSSISFSGIGLHTGEEGKVTIHPADSGHGIKFKKSDNPDLILKADVALVSNTNRGTSIKSGENVINTVEHLLSAITGMGVDNVLIEVNGSEIPILDGSSKEIASKINEVGLEEQEADKKYLEFRKVVNFVDEESGASYTIIPSDKFELTVMVDYNSNVLKKQYAEWSSDDSYQTEIAPCRTFVFAHELTQLLENGLIKGGDVANAIVYSDEKISDAQIQSIASKMGKTDLEVNNQGILNNVALNFPNEAARHKLLDLIGDLTLVGAPIKAKIIANKPGHTGNIALARMLKKEWQKQKKLGGLPVYDPTVEPVHDVEAIKGFIPHRYPFLLVDKIIEIEPTKVVGIKNVTFNENFFMGHFPGNPIFPGVLQMEALAQTGGILALSTVEDPENYDTYFVKMDGVKFKRKVVPGDTMILKMELLSPIKRGMVHMQGTVYVGDQIVSEGELTAQIVKTRNLE